MALWFVARTQSNRERWAAENVQRQGHTPYLPIILETHHQKVGHDRIKLFRGRPLFPGYLFVQTIAEQWHFLTGTFGISGVVPGTASRPATVSDSIIQGLRAREVGGVVQLPPRISFGVGTQVRVTAGAFKDRIGVVDGMPDAARRKVLLDFLGRKTSILVAESVLEAA